MMKANGYLIFIENMILDLVTSVIEQITQLHGDLCPINADVLIGTTESSSPLPRSIEHLSVQVANKPLIQQLSLFLPFGPTISENYIGLFPFIELRLCGDVHRNQACSFIGIKWGRSGYVLKLHGPHLTKAPDETLQAIA